MIFCKRVNYLILVFFIIFIYNFGVCVAFCYEFINYLKKTTTTNLKVTVNGAGQAKGALLAEVV